MIVGIIGKKQSGKDTIADILVNKYNYKKYAYADPIKDIIKTIFKWGDERIEDKETIDPNWGISPRQALQNIGTELFQFELGKQVSLFNDTIGRNIWVKVFETWYSKLPKNTNVVVSDVRFLHEVQSLKKMEATIIKVERPDNHYVTDNHLSETQVNSFNYDYLITNDRTIAYLKNQITGIVNHIILNESKRRVYN